MINLQMRYIVGINCCLVCILMCCSMKHQNKFENFINYNVKNSGLLDNCIQDVAFDRNNIAWIASGTTGGNFLSLSKTDGRLTRFDGSNWKYFENKSMDEDYRYYNEIFIDDSDQLWLSVGGSYGYSEFSHFFSFDKEMETWIEYKYGEDSAVVMDMLEDQTGDVLILNYNIYWRIKDNKIKELRKYADCRNGVCYIDFIPTNTRNLFYAIGHEGIVLIELHKKGVQIKQVVDLPGNFGVSEIALSHNNHIWASNGNSIFHIKDSNVVKEIFVGNFNRESGVANSKTTHSINTLIEDSEGALWIASQKELYKYDLESGLITLDVPIKEHKGVVMNEDRIRCISVDKHDHIWVGTELSGIFVYTP